MKAVVYDHYGAPDVLHVSDVEAPAPGNNEVLIRIYAVSVSPSDAAFRAGNPFAARLAAGVRKPRQPILGDSLAGEIVAIGADVTEWQVGDKVFGTAGPGMGAYAEYITLAEDAALQPMPDGMSFAEGAAIADGGLTALPFLRDHGKIGPRKRVLINGASGAIGTMAIQIAKHYGADVTAVTSGGNAEMVKRVGADRVIDYTKGDFTRSGERYDIIFDAVGKNSFGRAKHALAKGGIYLDTVPRLGTLFAMLRTALVGSRKAVFATTGLRKAAKRKQDLAFFAELYAADELRPVIERTYPLGAIAEAHAHVDSGRKKGNIVALPAASAAA